MKKESKKGSKIKHLDEELALVDGVLREAVVRKWQRIPSDVMDNLQAQMQLCREDRRETSRTALYNLLNARRDFLKKADQSAASTAAGSPPPKDAKDAAPDVDKILNELAPILTFMGKPAEYLEPVRQLLVENGQLAAALATAAKRNELLKKEVSSGETARLKNDLKALRDFLIPAKIILRATCHLRQQAIALTSLIGEFKQKDGVDMIAFVQALDECEALQPKKK